jgi:hypothetical protein
MLARDTRVVTCPNYVEERFYESICGYVMSYDSCCHHHVDANELLPYMHDCYFFQNKI